MVYDKYNKATLPEMNSVIVLHCVEKSDHKKIVLFYFTSESNICNAIQLKLLLFLPVDI